MRVVPRYLNFGRFRYFPKCFPAYSTLTRESVFPIFSFLETKKISSHYNFFSIFPFPLFFSSSLSFHFHPHISINSPPHKSSTSPLSLANPHWPRETPHPTTLQISPSLLLNCTSFTKSKTYKYLSLFISFLFSLSSSLHQRD